MEAYTQPTFWTSNKNRDISTNNVPTTAVPNAFPPLRENSELGVMASFILYRQGRRSGFITEIELI